MQIHFQTVSAAEMVCNMLNTRQSSKSVKKKKEKKSQSVLHGTKGNQYELLKTLSLTVFVGRIMNSVMLFTRDAYKAIPY